MRQLGKMHSAPGCSHFEMASGHTDGEILEADVMSGTQLALEHPKASLEILRII